jgi:1-acyl-sn-glycerol-3-phosphate acyltransferase
LAAPRTPPLARRIAARALARAGWRVDVRPPPGPKAIIVVYPHTSNWDFVVGYAAKVAIGLPVTWIGKDTLFRWPFGGLLRRMGGLPVNRREPTGLVAQLAAGIAGRPHALLALAPEGTRSRTDHWKSGFYQLALAARVPVGLAFIDWRARVVGLEVWLELSGDEEADFARIRAAYAGKLGRHPAQAGAIRLKP